MSLKKLMKLFNFGSKAREDSHEKNNNNCIQEKKEQNNYNYLDDIKDDVFNDINEDYINYHDCKTNRYNSISSINISRNIPEGPKANRISLDKIKDIPKYSRIKTNRNEYYNNNNQEEDYNEIIKDFLYISSYKTASTVMDLKNLKITNIINCSGDLCENLSPSSSLLNIDYLTLNVKDNVSENIECLFFKCIDYINEVKEKNGRVLIHCYKGVSRSVSLVIAYLIYLNKWTYDEAFDFVQSKRSIANPNIGFYLQLKTFHKRLTLETDRLEIFAITHFSEEQHDLIVCRLIYNNISLKNNPEKNKNKDEEEENESEDGNNNSNNDENVNNENKKDNEEEVVEKKEIKLNEKGMFIFAMKKNIFIVEGEKISDKNREIYKKAGIDYIKEIKKYEKLGVENKGDDVDIIKENDMKLRYNELINDNNVIIIFSDVTNMDKYYLE
jgi:hypothetical protein